MTQRQKIYITVLFIISLFPLAVFAQRAADITIEDIQKNPQQYVKSSVEVIGLVPQWDKGSGEGSKYYILKGSYGGIIRVNTIDNLPEIGSTYKVTGIVYRDDRTSEIFISEKRRTLLDEVKTIPQDSRSDSNSMIVFLVILLVIAVGIIYMLTKGKNLIQNKKTQTTPNAPRTNTGGQASYTSSAPASTSRIETTTPSNEFKTVKISVSPRTVKFVPGRIEIISGEDTGKSFKISGIPTAQGSVVTLGRAEKTGEAAYSHIKIDEKFRTVSRDQAEIIYKDGTLYIKNLSETNPTELNSKTLTTGQMVEVKPDNILSMGELKFKYIL